MRGGAGPMSYLMTLGFDPAKGKYVGTWIGSPMTTLFVYEGEVDGAGKSLPLNTTGPSFTDPKKMARFQDVYEVHGPDRRAMWSQAQNEDGSWTKFMSGTYTRVK